MRELIAAVMVVSLLGAPGCAFLTRHRFSAPSATSGTTESRYGYDWKYQPFARDPDTIVFRLNNLLTLSLFVCNRPDADMIAVGIIPIPFLPYPPGILARFRSKAEPLRIGLRVDGDHPFRMSLEEVSVVPEAGNAVSLSVVRGPAYNAQVGICYLADHETEAIYVSHSEIRAPAVLMLEFPTALPPHKEFVLKLSGAIYSDESMELPEIRFSEGRAWTVSSF